MTNVRPLFFVELIFAPAENIKIEFAPEKWPGQYILTG